MNTRLTLQKFFRGLHRNLFHSVPNRGPREVDLSRLQPIHDLTHERSIIGLQFTERARMTSSNGAPEPWEINDQDR
jgi:hypothetical protein